MFRNVLLTSLVAFGLTSSTALAGHGHHDSHHHDGHHDSHHHDGHHDGHHHGHHYGHPWVNYGCGSGSCEQVVEVPVETVPVETVPVSYQPSFSVSFRGDAQQSWQSAGSYALTEALQVQSTLKQSGYETFLKAINN